MTPGHMVYGKDGSIEKAARFMADKAKAAKGSSRTNLQLVDGYSGGGLLGGSEGGSNRLRGGLFGGKGKGKSKSGLFKRQDAATGEKSGGSDTTAAKNKSKLNGPTGGADGTDANTPTESRSAKGKSSGLSKDPAKVQEVRAKLGAKIQEYQASGKPGQLDGSTGADTASPAKSITPGLAVSRPTSLDGGAGGLFSKFLGGGPAGGLGSKLGSGGTGLFGKGMGMLGG